MSGSSSTTSTIPDDVEHTVEVVISSRLPAANSSFNRPFVRCAFRRQLVKERAKLVVTARRVAFTEFDETRRELAVEKNVGQEVGLAGTFPLADAPHDLADHARRAPGEIGGSNVFGGHRADVLRRPDMHDPDALEPV